MPIYRKRMCRQAIVDIAVEADDTEQAETIYQNWWKEPSNAEEVNAALSEREHDEETWFYISYENEDEYNRDEIAADFYIPNPDNAVKEEVKEPIYDLHFCYDEDPNHKLSRIWSGIGMKDLLRYIAAANEDYILSPGHPTSYQMVLDSRKRGAILVIFDLKERVKDV